MNSYLRQFVIRYLSIVLGTLMMVGFYAFVAIPLALGGHPGDERLASETLQAPIQVTSAPTQS